MGLTQAQIAAAHWDTSKPGLPLFRQLVKERVAEAMKGRAEIQAAPDDTARAIQEQRHRSLEARLKDIRLMGDAVIAAFFAEDKPKAREKKRAEVESWFGGSPVAWDKLAAMAATLKQGAHPLTPFHWEIEFPEVFARKMAVSMRLLEIRHSSGARAFLQTLAIPIVTGLRHATQEALEVPIFSHTSFVAHSLY